MYRGRVRDPDGERLASVDMVYEIAHLPVLVSRDHTLHHPI